MPNANDIIVENLLKRIQAGGLLPWQKPWKGAGMAPANYQGRQYNGANAFILAMMGYAKPVWLTFNQVNALGGKIKAGEKATPVIFWTFIKKKDAKNDKDTFPFLKYFNVWNIDQVEGVADPAWFVKATESTQVIDSNAICESVVNGYKNAPTIKHGGDRACYSPTLDTVTVPERNNFQTSEHYYSTMFHELAHSTGHESRLNRKEITKATMVFGDHDYSLEELVAELTACFLSSHCGIAATVIDNSASYLANWFNKLKDEPKMFVTAASRAQKAANHILGDYAKQDEASD